MKIAVVGSGISGLTCGYHLADRHDVSVFESQSHIGGHTHTHTIQEEQRSLCIDTGFIVFNKKTYPNFLKLIESLGVSYKPTSMSFSVASERSGLEYNGTSIDTLFAQRKNILRPDFWYFISGILKFNKAARKFLETDDLTLSLSDFFKRYSILSSVIEQYIVPMTAAVWSSDPKVVFDFPARFILRFFQNHGFLEVDDRPQWYVISGGSFRYIDALTKNFSKNIKLETAVRRITRLTNKVLIETALRTEEFDHVILATHSDQALKLLSDPSRAERDILGAIPYTKNPTYLHTDLSFLPKTKRAWASWNYSLAKDVSVGPTVTYNMNILQGLESKTEYNVTLNPHRAIAKDKILKSLHYAHPLFTTQGVRAQSEWSTISGVNHTHYCGAYWLNGFHEDGVVSALRVVDALEGRNGTSKFDLSRSGQSQPNLA